MRFFAAYLEANCVEWHGKVYTDVPVGATCQTRTKQASQKGGAKDYEHVSRQGPSPDSVLVELLLANSVLLLQNFRIRSF